ncbi:MAG: cobyric acid synthase, partial [Myxococcota bacterium]
GHMQAIRYRERLPEWARTVHAAYDRLADTADIVVLEGAGSPAEINLKSRDIVNMSMAAHAIGRARAAGRPGNALLVGDIERGGVFASLFGTLALLPPEERALFDGVIINRFRGDPRLLAPGPQMFTDLSGVRVRGVLPYRADIAIDEEDSQDLHGNTGGVLDVCVIRLPTVSNFTDLSTLGTLPDVSVRYASRNEDIGNPDLLVLPGAKDTLADLRWMKQTGLDQGVIAAAQRTIPILGLCGGYQILGRSIRDPRGVGGAVGEEPALGLLPVKTVFSPNKTITERHGVSHAGWLLPEGTPVRGYEIHQGQTSPSHAPLLRLGDQDDGAIAGNVAGTYLHGLLDTAQARRAILDALRGRRALPPLEDAIEDVDAFRDRQYDLAADVIEAHLDLDGLLPSPNKVSPHPHH